jgi:hypothetical protein
MYRGGAVMLWQRGAMYRPGRANIRETVANARAGGAMFRPAGAMLCLARAMHREVAAMLRPVGAIYRKTFSRYRVSVIVLHTCPETHREPLLHYGTAAPM